MNAKVITPLAVGVLLLTAGSGWARDPGDPEKGRVLAQQSCASCHAIDDSRAGSPHLRATPFPQVARTPGMTPMALRAALQTSHKTMPNLVFQKRGREDVIAYILSLKRRRPAT